MMVWRVAIASIFILALLRVPTQAQADLDPAVFALWTIEKAERGWGAVGWGTAFFTSADGTAITNSHVVFPVKEKPDSRRLMAQVGRELYSADVVCASAISSPDAFYGSRFGRDLAVMRVKQFDLPLRSWGMTLPNNVYYEYAAAHEGAVPEFPFLEISGDPAIGQKVRVVGYGDISAIMRKWQARGIVEDRVMTGGITGFSIRFSKGPPAQSGNSGSPVLDEAGKVVGVYAWGFPDEKDLGLAMGATALRPDPCRPR